MTRMEQLRREYTDKKPTFTKPNRSWQVFLIVDNRRFRIGTDILSRQEADWYRTQLTKALMKFLQAEERPR